MPVRFALPPAADNARHHEAAAAENTAATTKAILAVSDAISRQNDYDKILLRAAAGARKSVQLRRMVVDALSHPACVRVAVTAFMNRQVWPLAKQLADQLGGAQVCLLSSTAAFPEVPDEVTAEATVVTSTAAIPPEARVVIGTASRLGAIGEYGRQLRHFGPGGNDSTPYDVLFVDEAWQMALHLFAGVRNYAP